MPAEHLAAILAAHWRLLWVFSPAERVRRLEEIRQDLIYNEIIAVVADEMGAS